VVSKAETGMPDLGKAALAMTERNVSADILAAEKCLG
jgi:hypothetical protein